MIDRRPSWANPRRSAAAALTVALVAGVLALAVAPADAAPSAITGRVFRDFNGNGIDDGAFAAAPGYTFEEIGQAGVTVTVFDDAGAVIGTATSGADGTYTVSGLPSDGTPVRVEFTGLPQGMESGRRAPDGSGTSVQFVSVGAADVDYAVNAPEDFVQGLPVVATPIMQPGDPNHSSVATRLGGGAVVGRSNR